MKQFTLRALCAGAAAVLAACGGGEGDESAAASRSYITAASTTAARATAPGVVRVPGNVTASLIDARLRTRKGELDVWVQLDQASLASTRATLALTTGVARVRAPIGASADRRTDAPAVLGAMKAQRASIAAQQDATAQ